MLVKNHIAYGLVFSVILYAVFPKIGLIGMLIIFLSGILIDTDHYIYTVIKDRHWNLKKSIKYFKSARKKRSELPKSDKRKYYSAWCFIHGIESLIILFFLGRFIHYYFYFVLIGVGFHLILDLIEQIKVGGRIDKISLVYDYFKFRKLKRILCIQLCIQNTK